VIRFLSFFRKRNTDFYRYKISKIFDGFNFASTPLQKTFYSFSRFLVIHIISIFRPVFSLFVLITEVSDALYR
jgi:hypothetical protein